MDRVTVPSNLSFRPKKTREQEVSQGYEVITLTPALSYDADLLRCGLKIRRTL